MTTQNKALARRIFEECFNQGRLEAIDQVLAASYENHDPAKPAGLVGPQGMKQLVQMYRTGFPDLRMTIQEQLVEGDRVVTRWMSTGTHKGALFGIAASNARVSVSGITIDRVENGKIAESWTSWDYAGLLTQIGAQTNQAPPPPRPGDGQMANAAR